MNQWKPSLNHNQEFKTERDGRLGFLTVTQISGRGTRAIPSQTVLTEPSCHGLDPMRKQGPSPSTGFSCHHPDVRTSWTFSVWVDPHPYFRLVESHRRSKPYYSSFREQLEKVTSLQSLFCRKSSPSPNTISLPTLGLKYKGGRVTCGITQPCLLTTCALWGHQAAISLDPQQVCGALQPLHL